MKTQNKRNIYLVGFMGSGKSTIGPLLAKTLGRRFADTDAILERRFKLPIAEIFKRHGEKKFRIEESRLIRELTNKRGWIISLGGGALLRVPNRKIVKKSGYVVYLSASMGVLRRRLKNERKERPLLGQDLSMKNLKSLHEKRAPGFRTADLRISTSRSSPLVVAERLSEVGI